MKKIKDTATLLCHKKRNKLKTNKEVENLRKKELKKVEKIKMVHDKNIYK